MTAASTSISPDARHIWRQARGPVAIVVLVIALGIVVGLLRSTDGTGDALDPRSAEPSGTRALARLLTDQGVHLKRAHSVADVHLALDAATGPDGDLDDVPVTLLIARPDWVPSTHLQALTSRTRATVLVAPARSTARELVPAVEVSDGSEARERAPGCDFAPASVAGTVTIGETGYRSDSAVASCYPTGKGFALLHADYDGTPVTLLGSGKPLTNEVLDEHGNAALSMRLLGEHRRLIWYLPSLNDPALRPGDAAGERSPVDLLPEGWKFGLLQAGIAVLLLALWRARRLGPLVGEPLPVVVHAAEATEGRALLYRRAGAADHAAAALRAAVIGRIIGRLGLPADAGPDAVAPSVAARTGRPVERIRELLYGPPPSGDAALVRLADDLDVLEGQVRTA